MRQSEPEETYPCRLFRQAGRPVPDALTHWEDQVWEWSEDYRTRSEHARIVEVYLDTAVYLFDLVAERVVLAYAISIEQTRQRDKRRMRGFPNVNIGVRTVMGDAAFPADRGHFLGHASGGVLDINLFPQRRELNRGWSVEGKQFRQMESFVATHPGVFYYHRPLYDDDTWIPCTLEYGVLVGDVSWWTNEFRNK